MINQKGLTLFEVLVSISVASIVIMLLMSLLTTTLVTKNEIDYSNQLDQAIFEMNDFLSRQFQDMGFKSIEDISDQYEDYQNVFIMFTEFEPVIVEDQIIVDRSVFTPYLLVLDINQDAIYFGELPYEGDPGDFENEQDTIINEFLQNPTRLSNPRLVIEEGSEIRMSQCVKTDKRNLNYAGQEDDTTCANTFLHFDLVVSYRLINNNTLPARTYRSTLFY